MGKYLKNPLCKFKLLWDHDGNFDRKIDIVSASFFKMNKYYKNFQIYVTGLKTLVEFIDKNTRGFIMRIFIDDNIMEDKQIMKILKSSTKVQIILFDCPKYKKGNFHIGLFPTLVRFFPMFDFENNDAGHVIITDIDNLHKNSRLYELDTIMKTKNKRFMGNASIHESLAKQRIPYIMASFVGSGMKYDKEMILDYILNTDKYSAKGRYSNSSKIKDNTTKYEYGIDEIFLNNVWIKSLDSIDVYKQYQIGYFIYHNIFSFDRKIRLSESEIATTEKILKEILGKMYEDGMTIKDMFNKIDTVTYRLRKFTEESNYLTKRFTKAIKFTQENNKKWLDKRSLDFVYNYLQNVIYSFVIVNVRQNGSIGGVKLQDTVLAK